MSVSHASHRQLAAHSSSFANSPSISINESESVSENIARISSSEQFNDATLATLVNYMLTSIEDEPAHIDEIRLANKQITGKGLKTLNQVFKPNIHIDTLELSHTRLGPAAVESLAKALSDYNQLNTLLLADVEAGDRGCMALADMLVKPDVQLQTLDLRNNQIGSDGGRAMIRALQSNKDIIRLLIGGNAIDQNIIEQINALMGEVKVKKITGDESLKSPASLSLNMMRRPTVLENAEQFKRPDLESINAINRLESDPTERIGAGSTAAVYAAIPRKSVISPVTNEVIYESSLPAIHDDQELKANSKIEHQQRQSLVDIGKQDYDIDDSSDDKPRKRSSIVDKFRRFTITKRKQSLVVEELNVDETAKYCEGSETDQDQFEFLLKRVKKDSAEAMFSLGYLFDIGAGGVHPNTTEAIKWYREASQKGHAIAMNNLGVLLSTGHRGRTSQEHAEASYWYRKSAEKGYISGQFHLGLVYMSGNGMDKPDSKQAFHWFKQAGKQGHVLAQSNVGAMYMNGKGTEQNYKKAMKWCKKAAAHMNAVAIHNIGVMYEHGFGCKADRDKADAMFEKVRSSRVDAAIPIELSEKTIRDGGALMNL